MAQGKKAPLEERFWEKVDKTEGCWLWTASRRKRGWYGQIGLGGRGGGMAFAHRVSWEIHFGTVPDGLHVLHRCDNPICVRPDHLFLGTIAENNADRAEKGRGADIRGERSYWNKLTEEQVSAIRADTRLQREIAEAYGISQVQVSRIKRGHRWEHSHDASCSFVRRRGLKGGDNKNSKLTEDQVRAIRDDGRFNRVIAEEYGMCAEQVARIKRRQAWADV